MTILRPRFRPGWWPVGIGFVLASLALNWWDWARPFLLVFGGPALLLLGVTVLIWRERGRLSGVLLGAAVASLLAPLLLYVFVALTAGVTRTPSSPLYQALFWLQVAVYVATLVGGALARRWLAVGLLLVEAQVVGLLYFLAIFVATCGLFDGGGRPCP